MASCPSLIALLRQRHELTLVPDAPVAIVGCIGAHARYERGLEYQQHGEVISAGDAKNWLIKFFDSPGVTETFGYLDFTKWLRRQEKTDAEVLLRKSTTDISHTDLGKQFGRDRHWSKRVYMRMAKKLIRETGLFPHQIEDMVAEALRRHVDPSPVVRVTLGKGRETFSYNRQDKDEQRDVCAYIGDDFISDPRDNSPTRNGPTHPSNLQEPTGCRGAAYFWISS